MRHKAVRDSIGLALACLVGLSAPGAGEEPQPLPRLPIGLGIAAHPAGELGCRYDSWPAAVLGCMHVHGVEPGGSAGEAGIQEGDVLMEVRECPGGPRLRGTVESLRQLVARAREGQQIGAAVFKRVTLLPAGSGGPGGTALPGLATQPAPEGHQTRRFFPEACVAVTQTEPGSPAAAAGVRCGDLVTGVWPAKGPLLPVRGPQDLEQAMRAAGAGGTIGIAVARIVSLRRWPPCSSILHTVAVERSRAGDHTAAVAAARGAVSRATGPSELSQSRRLLIRMLRAAGRGTEALAEAERAMHEAAEPRWAASFVAELGECYKAVGQAEAGAERLESLLPGAAEHGSLYEGRLYRALAGCYCAAGDHERAIACYRDRLGRLPEEEVRARAGMWRCIAYEHSHLGHDEDAAAAIARGAKLASVEVGTERARGYAWEAEKIRQRVAGPPERRVKGYLELWQQGDFGSMYKAWAPEAKTHGTRAQFVRELQEAAAAGTTPVDFRNPGPLWEELGQAAVLSKNLQFAKDLPPNFVSGSYEFELLRDDEGIWRIAAITRSGHKRTPLVSPESQGPARLPPRTSSASAERARYRTAEYVWKGEFQEAALFLQTEFEMAEDDPARGEILMLQAWVEFRAGDKGAAAALLDRVVKDYPALKARAEGLREAWWSTPQALQGTPRASPGEAARGASGASAACGCGCSPPAPTPEPPPPCGCGDAPQKE